MCLKWFLLVIRILFVIYANLREFFNVAGFYCCPSDCEYKTPIFDCNPVLPSRVLFL